MQRCKLRFKTPCMQHQDAPCHRVANERIRKMQADVMMMLSACAHMPTRASQTWCSHHHDALAERRRARQRRPSASQGGKSPLVTLPALCSAACAPPKRRRRHKKLRDLPLCDATWPTSYVWVWMCKKRHHLCATIREILKYV